MYSSPIFTSFGFILFPGDLVGSNAKLIPLTCGNLPSNFGHCETLFSKHCIIWGPIL